jgi:ABC-type transport system involved in Fe-S cluster assembly fused permease/ATPase subunit
VQGALETLAEGWTTIVLVHRLWTGAPADQFVELNHGRVTGRERTSRSERLPE